MINCKDVNKSTYQNHTKQIQKKYCTAITITQTSTYFNHYYKRKQNKTTKDHHQKVLS